MYGIVQLLTEEVGLLAAPVYERRADKAHLLSPIILQRYEQFDGA